MNRFANVASSDQALKWVYIWFSQLARSHRKTSVPDWEFSADEVIAFPLQKRDAGGAGVEADEGHLRADRLSTTGPKD